ncbi:MAG: hypothetical protein M0Z94_16080 [Dehalococcoidales bacterium]|nr:hypothetical protein [Dehalococcoidales bacterium]
MYWFAPRAKHLEEHLGLGTPQAGERQQQLREGLLGAGLPGQLVVGVEPKTVAVLGRAGLGK